MEGNNPGSIRSLLGGVDGCSMEVLHKNPGRVESALNVKASNILLNFRLGLKLNDITIFAARYFFG